MSTRMQDLNAGYDNDRGARRSGSVAMMVLVRLFINIGSKDGITTNEKLLAFVAESTDIEVNLIQRITVREMSSFFNVPANAVDFISTALSQRKLKGRKVRIEQAEERRVVAAADALAAAADSGGRGYGGRTWRW